MVVALELKQGDTWLLTVGWYQPLPNSSQPDLSNPVNITGHTARLQVRRRLGDLDAPALALTSSPAAGLVVDGPAGLVTSRATPAQTAAIAAGMWYWELELSNGTDTHTIAEGPLTVRGQVVR